MKSIRVATFPVLELLVVRNRKCVLDTQHKSKPTKFGFVQSIYARFADYIQEFFDHVHNLVLALVITGQPGIGEFPICTARNTMTKEHSLSRRLVLCVTTSVLQVCMRELEKKRVDKKNDEGSKRRRESLLRRT